jgi:DNA-binding protein HU-beta
MLLDTLSFEVYILNILIWNGIMNKQDFITLFANSNACTQVEAKKMVKYFTDAVSLALSKGKDVELVGFGTFKVKKTAERAGRNPKTGEALTISARNAITFKVGQPLKDACNKTK